MQRTAALLVLAACGPEGPDTTPAEACGDGVRDEFEICDDGNTASGDGCSSLCALEQLVTVTWVFYPTIAGPALEGACRDGVATVELVTEVDTTMPYPCDANRTGTVFVPLGKQVLARLRAPGGDIVAESLPQLPSSGGRVTAAFYEDAGYIRASFARPDGCLSQPHAIELVLTPAGGGTPAMQTFPCVGDVGLVVSAPILAGTYDAAFTNTFGQTIVRTGVVVRPNNAVTDLDFR